MATFSHKGRRKGSSLNNRFNQNSSRFGASRLQRPTLHLSTFGQRAHNLVQQRQRVVGPVRFAFFKIVA
jgi:hypothetical protein